MTTKDTPEETKRVYGQWAGNPNGTPEDTTRCIERVWKGRGQIPSQCQRKRRYGKDGLYCKQHDPERVEARRKVQDEKWQAELKTSKEKHRRKAACFNACENISTEALESGVVREMLEALKANIRRLYIYKRAIADRQAWTGDKHGSCHLLEAFDLEIKAQENLVHKAEGRGE